MSQPQYQGPPPGPQYQGPPPGPQYQGPPPGPQYQGPPPGLQYQGPPPAQPGQTNVMVVSQQQPFPAGACSQCGSTATKDSFTCCGILLAILFFPLGLICCLLMTEKQCANCGASV